MQEAHISPSGDNDAAAVSTCMQADGEYGLRLLWTLILTLPIFRARFL
jgi:Mn2+/Fe2+ NRAMP family transporter